ncbi:MAG: hypothetical protein HY996_12305 [Micrococcales bacterium]|nr:hypothetical protein [Micrococcales bacterium]
MSETGTEGDEPQRARIRRAPKLGVFIGVGIVLGVLASLILTSTQKADPQVGFAATAGYFALYGIAVGALVGALVGVILDAVLRRRSREAVVARDRMGGDGPSDGTPAA